MTDEEPVGIPAEGMEPETFEVAVSRGTRFLGGVMLVVAVVVVWRAMVGSGSIVDLFLASFCTVFGAGLLLSKGMKRIVLTEDRLILLPAGQSLDLDAIRSAQVDWPASYVGRSEPVRIRFDMARRSVAWIPFDFLWLGEFASLRVAGVRDGKGLVDALARKVRVEGLPA